MSDLMHSPPRRSLPPPGHRWGRGARSLLPYLAGARLRAGAAQEQAGDAEAIRNPVFRNMDIRLLWRDR